MEFRAERLVLGAGLAVWAVLCVRMFQGALSNAAPLNLLRVTGLGATLSFGPAFAWSLHAAATPHHRVRVALAVTWQMLCSLVWLADLAYLVAPVFPSVWSLPRAALALLLTNVIGVTRLAIEVAPVEGFGVVFTHVAWQVFGFAVGLVATSERKQRLKLTYYAAQLTAAQEQLTKQTRIEERLTLARDLHDTIGHHLVGLSIQLELARHSKQEVSRTAIENAQHAVKQMLKEVRDVVSLWRSPGPVELQSAFAPLASKHGTHQVHVDIEPNLLVYEANTVHTLYRCAQEAITNAIRHGEAKHVWLCLSGEANGVQLLATDDGCGYEGPVELGNGLRGMNERITALGGRVSFSAQPNDGFTVKLWIPHPH